MLYGFLCVTDGVLLLSNDDFCFLVNFEEISGAL